MLWVLQICERLHTMASTSHLDIEKFNGTGYEMWKLKVEDLLEERDQWLPVSVEKKPSTSTLSDEDWNKLDKKA